MEIIYLPEVKKFIRQLDIELKAEMAILIGALIQSGHLLRMPYSKALGKGLFELRVSGKIQIRIFYCFHKGKIYLLHSIIKKKQKLGTKDIRRAHELKTLVAHL